MLTPTIQPKFLKNGTDLGIVAVGFSGGQVRKCLVQDESPFAESDALPVQSRC